MANVMGDSFENRRTPSGVDMGQQWIVAQNWYRKRCGQPAIPAHSVGRRPQPLAVPSVFIPGEHERCLLVRLSVSEFVAFNQKCTHLSCAVIPR